MGKRVTSETFLERAKAQHGDKYSYDLDSFSGMSKSVTITCPIHGEFSQQAYAHCAGSGCPHCKGKAISDKKSRGLDHYVRKAKEVHGDKYSYHADKNVNSTTKVRITCPSHGDFWQTFDKHLNCEVACPECRKSYVYSGKREGASEVIRRARLTHGDAYEYNPDTITTIHDQMTISCPEHGEFSQSVDKHINRGDGCPTCSSRIKASAAEVRIRNFVGDLAAIEHSDRTQIRPKELDIYVPDAGLAIEYCGLYWHSDAFKDDNRYHYKKWKTCHDKGIRLITIFEDEDEGKVKSALLSILGKRPKGFFARKCCVKEVPPKEASRFLNKHHLQGSCTKKVSYGLYYDGDLVSLMCFGKPTRQSRHEWELKRFCTDGRTHPGAASRLWKAFLRDYAPETVVSMSDRRWFTGGMYEKLGFQYDGEVRPDYYYIKNRKRYHKSRFKKSRIKSNLPEWYDESKTEKQMMKDAGYHRIWDCGKDRWVWESLTDTQD